MEIKDYIINGITIVTLILLGINVMPEDTHFCEDLNLSMHCERISSTGITCYPNLDDNKGYKRCYTGWKNIIFEEEKNIENIREEYICSVNNCTLKNVS